MPNLHNCFSKSVLKLHKQHVQSKQWVQCILSSFNHVLTLYRRQREKHRAHLTEIRNLRDCTVNASDLMSKSIHRTERTLQLQKVTPSSWFVYVSEREFA